MNGDSLLFLALTTLFGVSCLLVGWVMRGMVKGETAQEHWYRDARRAYGLDETDEAGA